MIREAALGQRFERECFEFRRHRIAIDRRRLLRRLPRQRFLLDELPLHRIERRQVMVPRLEIMQRFMDTEQLPDEIFEMRRHLNDQLGRLLRRQRCRILASRRQPRVQLLSGLLKLRKEYVIQTHQGVPIIKILKREPERQR